MDTPATVMESAPLMANSDRLMAFSSELLSYFRTHGMTQAGLAKALGDQEGIKVTGSAVGEWLRGEAEPSRDKVFALERILEADPGTFTRPLGYEPPADRSDATDYNSRLARMPDHVLQAVNDIIDAEERRRGLA